MPALSDIRRSTTGTDGTYYPTAQIEGAPAFTRLDSVVDFIWKNTTPVGGEIGGQFAVRWTGFLVPPTSGSYRLGVNGHTGYQLYLDGELLVEYQGVHHALRRTKEVQLEAGRLHRIQLDYTNDGIDPWAQLVWAVPGLDEAASALEVADKADVVVMCLGLTPYVEGEEMPVKVEGFVGGDRTDIALPKTQQALLERVHALGKPVVLVLLGGSAIAVNWADAHVPAILQAWYPGEAGGTALADILFGDTNPSGRLPVTVYRSINDLPPFSDYTMANRTYRYFRGEPLYPFGHGLSYTAFAYDNFKAEQHGDFRRRTTDGHRQRAQCRPVFRRRGRAVVSELPQYFPAQSDPAVARVPTGQPRARREQDGQLHTRGQGPGAGKRCRATRGRGRRVSLERRRATADGSRPGW